MESKHKPRHSADPLLLLAIIGLVLFGLIMITSASTVIASRFRADNFYFFKHQLAYGGLGGLAVFLLGLFTPYRRWRSLALPALLISVVLLMLVFVPALRVASGGASRWIGVGPLTLQPTEITKFAFIIYLAALLEAKSGDIHNFKKSVVPFLVIMGIISLLVAMQPDVGTLIAIVVVAGAMIFAGGFRIRHLFLLALGGLASFALLINTAGYRMNRIMVYLHPELDPRGIGYQINQALLAVGTGGLWGLGFGRSRQKYHYLPEPAGDSVFAIISEELGFVRTSIFLLIFALIAFRGYAIARKAPDTFGQLLAVGITTWIISQMFINTGSILAITPLTGIPLPFISYGGTALAAMLFASGILLNISKYTND